MAGLVWFGLYLVFLEGQAGEEMGGGMCKGNFSSRGHDPTAAGNNEDLSVQGRAKNRIACKYQINIKR